MKPDVYAKYRLALIRLDIFESLYLFEFLRTASHIQNKFIKNSVKAGFNRFGNIPCSVFVVFKKTPPVSIFNLSADSETTALCVRLKNINCINHLLEQMRNSQRREF